MFGKRKFNVEENGDELLISYKWFTPIAFFLVFFCLFWDGFLVVWMMVDSPLFFKLFALIHVAVGVGLTYYTIALFINTTHLRVSKNEISISFTPLPWKGAKTVQARDIEQLYVKEHISHGKNGTSKSYSLQAIMKGGKDEKLLGSTVAGGAEDAQFLESKMEEFLGIRDRQVPGEHLGEYKPKLDQVPRQKKVEYNPTNITLQNLLKGYVLTYDLKSWEVIYEAQFDWVNGESDKLYRLSGEGNETQLLYVKQDMGLNTPFLEERIQSSENTKAFGMLNPQNAPLEVKFADSVYNKQNYHEGKMFSSDSSSSFVELAQWFYVGDGGQKSLRIVQYKHGEVALFLGTKAQEYEFTNLLPSNERGL